MYQKTREISDSTQQQEPEKVLAQMPKQEAKIDTKLEAKIQAPVVLEVKQSVPSKVAQEPVARIDPKLNNDMVRARKDTKP